MQIELLRVRCRALLLFVIACMPMRGAAERDKVPFPGARSSFHSYARYDFLYEGRSCIVVTPKTVEGHKTNLMAKLGVHNRVELVKYALRKGVINI